MATPHDKGREETKFEDIPTPNANLAEFPEATGHLTKAAVRVLQIAQVLASDGSTLQAGKDASLDTCIFEDTVVADRYYICKATIGSATSAAVWQIKRISVTSPGGIDDVDIGWADSDDLFNNIADNREALTYSK